MNKLKTNTRILLIIIVSVFIVVPFVSILLSKIFGINEGMSNYDMSGKNIKMDRVSMDNIPFTNLDNVDGTGGANDYLYCIGGDIVCNDGSDITAAGSYTDASGDTHNTYQHTCGTNSYVECSGNYLSTLGENTIDITDISNGTVSTFNGPSGEEFKGFLGPYDYVPMDISESYVYLYDSTGANYSYSSACYLYEASNNCVADSTTGGGNSDDGATTNNNDNADDSTTNNNDNADDSTTNNNDNADDSTTNNNNDDSCNSNQSMKCLADNGAKPGDPLCCGQDGVLQNTKYNCPSEYPHCIGYKCGETWGRCSATEAQ